MYVHFWRFVARRHEACLQAVVEEVAIVEGVAQIFYDRIEATCKGKGANVCSTDDVLLT